MQNFLTKHPPFGERTMPDEALLNKYKVTVPTILLDFWKESGFGKHSNGLFEFINPTEYEDTLALWLGLHNPARVPIMLSAFGELFYYRKLTDTDEDVSVIDVHYKDIQVVNWSLTDFIETDLCDDDFLNNFLDFPLFQEALAKEGNLEKGEIYSFVPALALGGAKEIGYVQKVNATVHLDFLFQL